MRFEKVRVISRTATCLASLVLFSLLLHTQEPQSQARSPKTDPDLRFEVATIKPHDPNSGKSVGVRLYPGGRVEIIGVSFKTLVEIALHRPFWEISGGDAWIEKDLYDVEAKPSDDIRASFTDLRYTWYGIEDGRLRQMLTGLLIDRFRLKFHRETKTGTVYVLERGSKPLGMVASERTRQADHGEIVDPGTSTIGVAGTWSMSDTSMPQLAKFASDYILRAPVLDETHLDGYFDYRSATEVDMSNMETSNAAFMPFISEMGLRLKKSEGPVETIVIDHVEKPSAN